MLNHSSRLLITLLLTPLLVACSQQTQIVAKANGSVDLRIEQRCSSGWRTRTCHLWLLHGGDELPLTLNSQRASRRSEEFGLVVSPEGERVQWFDGERWEVSYFVPVAPGIISDPRIFTEQRPWPDVAPLLVAAASWLSTDPPRPDANWNRRRTATFAPSLEVARSAEAPERRTFLLAASSCPKPPQHQRLWLELAESLPIDQRAELVKELSTKAGALKRPIQASGDFLILALSELMQTTSSDIAPLVKLLRDEQVSTSLRSTTYVTALRAVAKENLATAAETACTWFASDAGGRTLRKQKFSALPLIALAKTPCPAATAYASTLGYCCSKACTPDQLLRSSEGLWNGTASPPTGWERDATLMSYLKDTGAFPHLPAYHEAYGRLAYTQAQTGASCVNPTAAGQPCDCPLTEMQATSCRAPTETVFESSRHNCRFVVNDETKTFEKIVSLEARPTRVFLETPFEGTLSCRFENPPYARSQARYQWLANGEPFQQVSSGDPSMPAGLGRGSTPDPDRLLSSEVPDGVPKDATFQCEVRFINQDDGITRILKGTRGHTADTYRSSSAPLKPPSPPAP